MEWMHYRTLPLQHIKGSQFLIGTLHTCILEGSPLSIHHYVTMPERSPLRTFPNTYIGEVHTQLILSGAIHILESGEVLLIVSIYISERPPLSNVPIYRYSRGTRLSTQRTCTIYIKGPHFQLYLISTKHQR